MSCMEEGGFDPTPAEKRRSVRSDLTDLTADAPNVAMPWWKNSVEGQTGTLGHVRMQH